MLGVSCSQGDQVKTGGACSAGTHRFAGSVHPASPQDVVGLSGVRLTTAGSHALHQCLQPEKDEATALAQGVIHHCHVACTGWDPQECSTVTHPPPLPHLPIVNRSLFSPSRHLRRTDGPYQPSNGLMCVAVGGRALLSLVPGL